MVKGEIASNDQKVVYDIIHGNIELSNLESLFLKNPIINRLHQILQNSTAYTVFPNIKTSRFEHSLGTMDYTGKIYRFGMINSNFSNEFLEKMKIVVGKLLNENGNLLFSTLVAKHGEKKLVYRKTIQKEFSIAEDFSDLEKILDDVKFEKIVRNCIGDNFTCRNVLSNNSNNSALNFLLFQAIRLFGLLHDVGHLPLSHLFEFSIERMFDHLKNKKNKNQNEEKYLKILSELLGLTKLNKNSEQIHEKIGKNITKYIFYDISIKILANKGLTEKQKSFNLLALFTIEQIWNEIIKGNKGQLYSLYAIVSGTVDADRLDYVQRDGFMSGIAKSPGNINRIVEMFCLGKIDTPQEYIFAPSIQSLNDIEEMLHHRFRIYKYVVGHHAVKRSDYIFQKVIEEKLKAELQSNENIDTLNPTTLLPVILIAHKLSENLDVVNFFEREIQFIQITDYWLLSVLNKEFIESITNTDFNRSQKTLLGEIYQNKREFKSLWKRSHEFNDFITELGKEILETVTLGQIENILNPDRNENLDKKSEERFLEIKKKLILCYNDAKSKTDEYKKRELIKDVEAPDVLMMGQKQEIEKKKNHDFVQIEQKYFDLGKSGLVVLFSQNKRWIYKLEEEMQKIHKDAQVLVTSAVLKSGIKEFYLIDKKNQENIYAFDNFSTREKSIIMDLENSIRFYVYYSVKTKKKSVDIQKSLTGLMSKYLVNLIKI